MTLATARSPHDKSVSRFLNQSIWLVGIGGCGMSGLARMLRQLGAKCSGSDASPAELTSELSAGGIPVAIGQDARNLPEECDLVIASAAIKPDNPELLAAMQRGIRTISYAEALGLVQAERTGISIAGTHGKSTTTAMLSHVLIESGLDPSFIVGATCMQIGGGSRVGAPNVPGHGPYAGRPGYFIAEACEFNRSFHHHRPVIGLINNVEEDHLDVYASLSEIVTAFRDFARILPPASEGGRLLIAHEGAHRREVTAGVTAEIETFGFQPLATWQVVTDKNVRRVGVLQ